MEYLQSDFKKNLDRGLALLLGLVAGPIIPSLLTLVWLEDFENPIFRQFRQSGSKNIEIMKIRTMKPGADLDIQNAIKTAENSNTATDPRNTRVGRTLRKFNIEELLQIYQVARGDFFLIAPRIISPHRVDQAEHESKLLGKKWRAAYESIPAAGLFNLFAIDDPFPKKASRRHRYDLLQIEKASLGLDLYLLARGLWISATGKTGRQQ